MPVEPATPHPSVSLDAAAAWTHSPVEVRLAAISASVIALATALATPVPIAAGAALVVLIAAAIVDLDQQRLPDGLLGGAAILLVFGGLLESLAGRPLAVGQMAGGAVACTLPLLALHLWSPTSIGFGDVKLGPLLGAVGGSLDWRLGLWALALGAAASATTALARRSPTIALGPGLVVSTITLLALATAPCALQVGRM